MTDATSPVMHLIDFISQQPPPLPVSWEALYNIHDTHQGATYRFYSEKTSIESASFVTASKIWEFQRYLLTPDIAVVPDFELPLANEQAVVESSYAMILMPVAIAANRMVAETVFMTAKYTDNKKTRISLRRAVCVLLKVFEYRVTISSQLAAGNNPFYLDHFFAFEPTATIVGNRAVVTKIARRRDKQPWCDAASFSNELNRLAEQLYIKQKTALDKGLLNTEYEHRLAVDVVRDNAAALPRISLLIQEEKRPSTIDLVTWNTASTYYNQPCGTNKALRNLRVIDAQVRTYSVLTHCPWVVVSEFNEYLLAKIIRAGIRMDRISLELSRDREVGSVEVDRNDGGLSARSLVMYPIIHQLRDAGVLTVDDLSP